ncbi:membrane anchor subunit of succinate dehydrogenase, Sdh4 [Sticta canariensis]|nr:membrane anchor subunit of succinate dehydrogenase, Sdh4 [Sticta canariensis]
MASILRPVLLPQRFRIVSARKIVAHETSQYPALRPRVWPSLRTQPTASHVLPNWSFLVRRTPPISVQASDYHSSSPRAILPPGLQIIEGTANDPAPIPDPSPTHGSYHWTFERLGSAALIPLTIAPFAAGSINPIADAALCATILIHSHIGFQSMIIDYIPGKRLPKTRALFWWGLRGATLLVAVGLYEFETSDVGLTEAIKKIWAA